MDVWSIFFAKNILDSIGFDAAVAGRWWKVSFRNESTRNERKATKERILMKNERWWQYSNVNFENNIEPRVGSRVGQPKKGRHRMEPGMALLGHQHFYVHIPFIIYPFSSIFSVQSVDRCHSWRYFLWILFIQTYTPSYAHQQCYLNGFLHNNFTRFI